MPSSVAHCSNMAARADKFPFAHDMVPDPFGVLPGQHHQHPGQPLVGLHRQALHVVADRVGAHV
jgi:hypothetical protein